MKKLLDICGYNSALSFKSIEESSLTHLETYIEGNHRKVVDEFAEYHHIKPFQFLPGHRSLILGIKDEISNIQSGKKKKVSKPSSKKLPRDNDELTLAQGLANQLSTYANGIGLKLDWASSIKKIELTETENATLAKCVISCPRCNNIRYDTIEIGKWPMFMASSLTHHHRKTTKYKSTSVST